MLYRMVRPSPLFCRTQFVRVVAALVLIAQGVMGVAVAMEPATGGPAPVMHVEAPDSPHADLQHSDHCILCTARHLVAARSLPPNFAFVATREFVPCAGIAISATPADPSANNPSRAPPTVI